MRAEPPMLGSQDLASRARPKPEPFVTPGTQIEPRSMVHWWSMPGVAIAAISTPDTPGFPRQNVTLRHHSASCPAEKNFADPR